MYMHKDEKWSDGKSYPNAENTQVENKNAIKKCLYGMGGKTKWIQLWIQQTCP